MRKNTIKTVMKDNFKVSPSQGFCQTNSATDFYTQSQKFFSIFWLTVAPFIKVWVDVSQLSYREKHERFFTLCLLLCNRLT